MVVMIKGPKRVTPRLAGQCDVRHGARLCRFVVTHHAGSLMRSAWPLISSRINEATDDPLISALAQQQQQNTEQRRS